MTTKKVVGIGLVLISGAALVVCGALLMQEREPMEHTLLVLAGILNAHNMIRVAIDLVRDENN